MFRFGFIGAGNMANAIIGGILTKELCQANLLAVYDVCAEKCTQLASKGIFVTADAVELVEKSEIVILAVKPQNYQSLLVEIAHCVDQSKILVSIAAGISTEYIQNAIGFPCKVVRVMPNTPLLLGCGAAALSGCPSVEDTELEIVSRIFSAAGIVEILPEEQMNAVISVNGSSPAYVYLLAKAMIDSAIAQGIAEDTAARLVIQTIIGSAQMLAQSGKNPDELIRMVASPGGTTLAALDSFAQDDFEGIVGRAMLACTKRAEELAR